MNWQGNETARGGMTAMPKVVAEKLTEIGNRPHRVGGFAGTIKKEANSGLPSGTFIWNENGERVQAPAGWQMSEQDLADQKEWTDFRDSQIQAQTPSSPPSVTGGLTGVAAPAEAPVLGSTFNNVSTPWDAQGILATTPEESIMPTPTTAQSRTKPGVTFASTMDPWQPSPTASPFAQASQGFTGMGSPLGNVGGKPMTTNVGYNPGGVGTRNSAQLPKPTIGPNGAPIMSVASGQPIGAPPPGARPMDRAPNPNPAGSRPALAPAGGTPSAARTDATHRRAQNQARSAELKRNAAQRQAARGQGTPGAGGVSMPSTLRMS
jgi:hypothetical protein